MVAKSSMKRTAAHLTRRAWLFLHCWPYRKWILWRAK